MNTPLNRRSFIARVLGVFAVAPLAALSAAHVAKPSGATYILTSDPLLSPYANAIFVRWLDQNGRMNTECVEDAESIRRDGYHPADVTYSGTSREEAMRYGRLLLNRQSIKS